MARRGRKRKIVQREGNGRAKRSVPLQKQPDIREVAMNQPHRRGSASDRLGTTVGRFLEGAGYLRSGLSLKGLHDSANRFMDAHRIWQVSIGSPRPYANTAAARGEGMSEEETAKAQDNWVKAWRALRAQGPMIERAIFHMLIDPQPEDWRPPFWIQHSTIEGLCALADHFGIDINAEDKEAPGRLLNAA